MQQQREELARLYEQVVPELEPLSRGEGELLEVCYHMP